MLRKVELHGFDTLAQIYNGITWPQKDPAGGMPISTWLRGLGPSYEEYSQLLLQQGYCTVQQMMKDDFMTEEDLKAFGIDKPGHTRKITIALHRLRERFMPQSAVPRRQANTGLLTFSAFGNDLVRTRSLRTAPSNGDSLPMGRNALKTFGKKDDFPEVSNLLNNITALSAIPSNRYERSTLPSAKWNHPLDSNNSIKALQCQASDVLVTRSQVAQPVAIARPIRSEQPDRNTNNLNASQVPFNNGLPPTPPKSVAHNYTSKPTQVLTQPLLQTAFSSHLSSQSDLRTPKYDAPLVDDVVLKKPLTEKSLEQYAIPPPPPPKPLRITTALPQTIEDNGMRTFDRSRTIPRDRTLLKTATEDNNATLRRETTSTTTVERKKSTGDDGSEYEIPVASNPYSPQPSNGYSTSSTPNSLAEVTMATNNSVRNSAERAISPYDELQQRPAFHGPPVGGRLVLPTTRNLQPVVVNKQTGTQMESNEKSALNRWENGNDSSATTTTTTSTTPRYAASFAAAEECSKSAKGKAAQPAEAGGGNKLIGCEAAKMRANFDDLDKVLSGIANELNNMLEEN